MDNKEKLRDLMTSLERRAEFSNYNANFKEGIYEKSSSKNLNWKRLEYRKFGPHTPISKSVAISKSHSYKSSNFEQKNDNEYGLINNRKNINVLKSFNAPDNMMLPIKEEFDLLSDEDVDQYLSMLITYVKAK